MVDDTNYRRADDNRMSGDKARLKNNRIFFVAFCGKEDFNFCMERRDYFKKQIDQLGRILGKILDDFLALKNTAGVGEAVESVVESLNTKLDLSLATLENVPHAEIVDRLISAHSFNNNDLELFADILLRTAEQRLHDNQWRKLMGHALVIFQHLETVDSTFSLERRYKSTR